MTRTCEMMACEAVNTDVITLTGVVWSSDVLCVPYQGTVSVLSWIDSDDDCCCQVSRWNHFAGVTLQMSWILVKRVHSCQTLQRTYSVQLSYPPGDICVHAETRGTETSGLTARTDSSDCCMLGCHQLELEGMPLTVWDTTDWCMVGYHQAVHGAIPTTGACWESTDWCMLGYDWYEWTYKT